MTDENSTTPLPKATTNRFSGESHAATEDSIPAYSVVDVPSSTNDEDDDKTALAPVFMPEPVKYEKWPPPPDYGSSAEDNVSNDSDPDRKERSSSPPADSAIDMPPNEPVTPELKPNLQTDKQIRMAFVRKVYCLLVVQLSVTVGISIWFRSDEAIQEWVNNQLWLFFVSWVVAFVILLLMYWKRKSYPVNLILLGLFTICISYSVATIVSVYDGKVVLQAFIITLGVVVGLVLFTLQSKVDFSSWGPFLYAGLWIVIMGSLVGWILPFDESYHIAVSVLSAMLFCAYIIFDTYNVAKKLSPEEYVMAAINLYLDIVSLFVALLALLTGIETS